MVETVGEGQSSGGRPPEMLRFNAEHGFVAAADIGGTRLRMMLTDLNGDPRAHWKGKLQDQGKTPAAVCALIHEGLESMCRDAGIAIERVFHMTVGAPGITDVERGIVRSAPNLIDWSDVPLRTMLEQKTGISVMVENDTNLAAVGEHWRGAADGVDDFVFIAMGTGVGSGIFLRGQLHHGAAWSAGEVGYLGVPGMPREPLQMQRTGQLERVIGGGGIEEDWMRRLALSGRDSDEGLMKLRASHIFDRSLEGDADAQAALNHAASILADAIGTITLLFNPTLVVLGGGIGSHVALCRATEAALATSDFPHPGIRSSFLDAEAQLFGAISLSLSAVESRLLC